jgi:hypothetical protein
MSSLGHREIQAARESLAHTAAVELHFCAGCWLNEIGFS